VLLGNLRAESGDEVVGIALRELGRDQQVDAVGPVADLLLDPLMYPSRTRGALSVLKTGDGDSRAFAGLDSLRSRPRMSASYSR
jgi:hypothetical protein